MVTVKKFEQLISWQKARELTRYIYFLTRKPKFSKDYGLKDQIQRAAVSTVANQAEGFTRGTKFELINYFYIAKGSAGEVQSHLYIASDQNYISPSEFQKAYRLAEETQRLIQSFVDKVKKGSRRGIQHKTPKRENPMKEFLEEGGFVFTTMGVMKKEEAEQQGLKPIEWNTEISKYRNIKISKCRYIDILINSQMVQNHAAH